MAMNITSTVSEKNCCFQYLVCQLSTIPPPTLPSFLVTKVRGRLTIHSPAMVNWSRLHKMKIVERSLNIINTKLLFACSCIQFLNQKI